MSQFVYKFMCTYPTQQTLYQSVSESITEFLWDKKRAKISFDLITRRLKDGGLLLTNLETREIALKTTWVKKSLNSECFWMYHAKNILPWKIPDIWNCNINEKNIRKIFKQKGHRSIWQDIWIAWSKYAFHDPISKGEI